MRIELPLRIRYLKDEDKNKAEILIKLVHAKLREKEYNAKLQDVIDEALEEVKRDFSV